MQNPGREHEQRRDGPAAGRQQGRKAFLTLPQLYKLGLKRTVLLAVVRKITFGGRLGYASGTYMSKK